MQIAVIGAGSWGTTLAILLSKKGYNISLWVHNKKLYSSLNITRENSIYLPGFKLKDNIKIFNEIADTVQGCEIIVSAVPSFVTKDIARQLSFTKEKIIIIATKGIPDENFKTNSQIYEEEGIKNICVLSGPNIAKEIAKEIPSASVLASKSEDIAKFIQNILSAEHFRIYTQDDVIGVELGGALKNIYAIASGLSDALFCGTNSKSAIITRSLVEMIRIGEIFGAKEETFRGLSGLGDLIVTSFSKESRNYALGYRIGKGEKLHNILNSTTQIFEGVNTTKIIYNFSKLHKVETPIADSIYKILFEEEEPYITSYKLLKREYKKEVERCFIS